MASHLCHKLLILNMFSILALGAFLSFLNPDAAGTSPRYCKPIPGSPDWPSIAEWQGLNHTIGGRLLTASPPGAVCHPSSASYDNVTCASTRLLWISSYWHAEDPVSTDYNDDTCLPDARAPCVLAGYPAFIINATGVADVKAGVQFAAKTGVRLIIKGTGHDFPGRSSGPHSLSIWTHHIRGITVDRQDQRAMETGGVASVKLGSGMRMGEIYEEMAKRDLTFVGGADLGVGVGGWYGGGGHSPVSSVYGLGADQVLEMEVVTADGQYRVVNATSHPDLFWAMRGGGPSTYAIVVSVTVKAYPPLPITVYLFSYNTTADSDTFWSMAAYFHSQIPQLSQNGAMGYYYVVNDPSDPDPTKRGKVLGAWLFANKTIQQVTQIMQPMEDQIRSANWPDPVSISNLALPQAPFHKLWLSNTPQAVGSSGRLGSWLLGSEGLSHNVTYLATQIRRASPAPWALLGHVVAGPGVRNAKPVGGSNAVLPAWRKAYVHAVLPRSWPYLNTTAKDAVTNDLRAVRVPALKALEPESGAYVNEADPTNQDWQHDYYGEHYPRLLVIKQKWDPHGVFWCKPCVGHELWEVQGGDGVGQFSGRLYERERT